MSNGYTPPNFQGIIDRAVETVLRDGFHIPTLFGIGRRQSVIVGIDDMPPTFEMRQQMMFVIGYNVSREPIGRLDEVVFISESWMSVAPAGGGEPHFPPSEDPERVEALVLSHYRMREGRLDMVAFRIIRDRKDRVMDLVVAIDTRYDQETQLESALMDAFRMGYHAGRKGRIPPAAGYKG